MNRCDILVVGAGAAGLLAALAARGALDARGRVCQPAADAAQVVLLNNTARLGLKILVSGGGRCNVTNAKVDEFDYDTDSVRALKGLLRGFPVDSVRALFTAQGCALHKEALGKLFPRSGRAADVLQVLLDAVRAAGIRLIAPAEVVALQPPSGATESWSVQLQTGAAWQARRVVLATGGKSLPKTGSRGFGLAELARLGHTVAPAQPALTSLRLRADGPLAGLAGLTTPVVLTLTSPQVRPEQLAGARYRPPARAAGSMLVTHKGISGPAAFDVSRACHGASASQQDVVLRGDFWSLTQDGSPWSAYVGHDKPPGACLTPAQAPRPPARTLFEQQAGEIMAQGERQLSTALAGRLPRGLVEGLLHAGGLEPTTRVKQLDARGRTALYLALTQADLGLVGTDGYAKAEVTAGGVLLGELDRRTLESRLLPGLHCCGEVVNVTGRLGGFNFQWAWASGYAAGAGAASMC